MMEARQHGHNVVLCRNNIMDTHSKQNVWPQGVVALFLSGGMASMQTGHATGAFSNTNSAIVVKYRNAL